MSTDMMTGVESSPLNSAHQGRRERSGVEVTAWSARKRTENERETSPFGGMTRAFLLP